ncbi:hypothetical protein Hgul01_04763 [Herpetosiphon gulosus]|uniref:Uncharacterized protein n=1 Tax=Herpetosiphon gulosus TaxID=1973496 RepID=A0ABP9X6B8_9CHLR
MNQKYVNILNLIAGLSSASVGIMQIYKMLTSDTRWIEIFGTIGFLLTGLFLLFQRKFNPIFNIIIISIALICFIINFISFFI